MYLCKFGQNPFTGSKDIASERSYADADADGIHTKNNMSPTFGWGDIKRSLNQFSSTRNFDNNSNLKGHQYNKQKIYQLILDLENKKGNDN